MVNPTSYNAFYIEICRKLSYIVYIKYLQEKWVIMNRFEKIIDKINNIPESLINTLSLISGIITIITPIIGYFKIKRNIKARTVGHISSQLIIIILILFGSIVLLMFLRMRKYRKLLMLSRHSVSEGVYKFLHDFRNLYFGLTKTHKNGEDSVSTLTREVKEYTINSLNELCNIFNSFTRKKNMCQY